MTKLSIIIPVYNEEPFLSRCLRSINVDDNSPHCDEVEVIAIDDASTDKSGEILDEYAHLFRVVHHTTNWGVAMTRNHGITLASGEWVTFLDSDDAMHPKGIENILNGLNLAYDANVMQFNHYRCKEEGCRVESRYYITMQDYGPSNLPPKWAPVWNKAYRKAFLDEHAIRFPSGQQFDEDRQFNLQCLHYDKKIKGSALPSICKYFDNEASICHTMTQEKLLKALDALVDRLAVEDDPDVCQVIKRSIIQHLESKNFKNLFGGL